MNVIPIQKVIRIAQLLDEVRVASPIAYVKIKTIHGFSTDDSGVSQSGEFVHDGTLAESDVSGIVAAHVPQDTNDQKIRAAAITAAITKLQNASCTNAEAQGILAKVLKYLRNEAI